MNYNFLNLMMHKTSKKGEADVKSNFINNHNREPRDTV